MTRKIIAFDRISADGYFSAEDGNLDWTVPEPELDKTAAGQLGGADTMLFGRRTYDMFESFWPKAVDQRPTAPDPHADQRRSEDLRALGVWINEANKVVFSKTRREVTWKNSRLIRELDPNEIRTLKKQPGKDMMIFGSGSLVSQLTQHGLIDEYHFVVCPVLLGKGRPLIAGVPNTARLKLLDSKAYPMGNIVLRYTRA